MKKRFFSAIIFLQVFVLCNAQEKIYVALSGNDNNAGTFSKPLKTVQAALAKVAAAKGKKVEVYLRAGRYYAAKTIEITPQLLNNHQLTISAYNNEIVTVAGSAKITAQWKSYKGNVLQTSIGAGLAIDQLFCNGKPLPMARYPNYDSSARVFNGTAADAISAQKVKKLG